MTRIKYLIQNYLKYLSYLKKFQEYYLKIYQRKNNIYQPIKFLKFKI